METGPEKYSKSDLIMFLFTHKYKIELKIPLYKAIRLLDDNVDTEKLWPWQKKKPFFGVISSNSFLVVTNSYFTQYKPKIYGTLNSYLDKTTIQIQIRQTPSFYLVVFCGILLMSGFFVMIEGTDSETLIAATVFGLFYYSLCLAGFFLQIKKIKSKFKKIKFKDNNPNRKVFSV